MCTRSECAAQNPARLSFTTFSAALINFFIPASPFWSLRRQLSSISLATFSANSLKSESSLWFFCSLPRSGSISVRRLPRSPALSGEAAAAGARDDRLRETGPFPDRLKLLCRLLRRRRLWERREHADFPFSSLTNVYRSPTASTFHSCTAFVFPS